MSVVVNLVEINYEYSTLTSKTWVAIASLFLPIFDWVLEFRWGTQAAEATAKNIKCGRVP